MEAFLLSSLVVAIAEIGDKTQLLAVCLAARFRAPWTIMAGILLATIANHGLAAWAGVALADWLDGEIMRWILGFSFLAMAAWMLVPDKEDDKACNYRFGPFAATLIAFFLVEIGDKTQVATIALAAHFGDLAWVAAGSTLGMLAANLPAVMIGNFAADRLPLKAINAAAAAIFLALGLAVIVL